MGAVVVAACVALTPGRASASCAAPSEVTPVTVVFHGRVLGEAGSGSAGTLYKFAVEGVDRGSVTSPAIVDIAVDRAFTGPNGEQLHQSSSVSIGPAPIPGERYHVEAYVGSDETGATRLLVNACGGKIDLVVESTSATATAAAHVPHHHSGPSGTARAIGVAVAAVGALLIASAVGVLRRRRAG